MSECENCILKDSNLLICALYQLNYLLYGLKKEIGKSLNEIMGFNYEPVKPICDSWESDGNE